MLHILRGILILNILILFGVISLVLIGLTYSKNSTANAPHQDGGSTVNNLADVFGELSIWMMYSLPYLIGTLVISIIGAVVLTVILKSK